LKYKIKYIPDVNAKRGKKDPHARAYTGGGGMGAVPPPRILQAFHTFQILTEE